MPAHRICAQGCGNPAVWGSVCMECAQTPNRFDPTTLTNNPELYTFSMLDEATYKREWPMGD